MKIGIDARLWNETGVGRYIRNLVIELRKIDKKNSYVLFVKNDFSGDAAILTSSQWKIVKTDIHWHSLREQLSFSSLLNKENCDLMHFPYFSLPIFYKKPFVVTIHDLIIHHFSTGKASTLPLPLYHAKRAAFSYVLRHALKKSRKVIVPLHAVKKDIIDTFSLSENKIAVTYEGFDKSISPESSVISRQKTTSDQRPATYFLYVGNAYPHKNIETLIKGFLHFKKEDKKDIQLYLVGKEDFFYKRLKSKLSNVQKKDIHFLHNVNDGELAKLYRGAVALVSASKMEGFGLPPLEALANNCLPVLSDIPSFKEVCQENALYFGPTDPKDLARTLEKVLLLPSQEKQKMLSAGKKRVEDFSWNSMARQTLAVYESATL